MKTLSRKQRSVIPLLLTGASVQEVARKSGISDTTLYRYLEDPAVQDTIDAALDQQLQDAFKKAAGVDLSMILPEATATIRDTLRDPKSKPRARLAAAKLAWDIALRIQQMKNRITRQYERE